MVAISKVSLTFASLCFNFNSIHILYLMTLSILTKYFQFYLNIHIENFIRFAYKFIYFNALKYAVKEIMLNIKKQEKVSIFT